ncbi:MAG: acyltransferase [Kiritimatiellae bacterium]|nr:acyltransferase [Kiritimatiellia bacterium]MCO5062224.1 acyltransferase [Kiritimatiellia bacterium]MCO6401861.1 acyltransferase [Verrucomicrobiota bacterium]
MSRESVEIQKELFAPKKSALAKYRDLVVGRPGLLALLRYELITAFSYCPGAFGLFVRSKLYPRLLGACGRGVVFGTGVVLRHPHKIRIGNDVVVDDHCVLDAKGQSNEGISIGSGVFIGRNSILSCKNGDIVLGDGANIGFNCEVFSGARVEIGARVMLAAYTYVIGGGHAYDRMDVSPLEQARTAVGVTVGEGAWLGAGVKVLDGTSVGANSIVGAGAVVTKAIPENSVAAGIPAQVLRSRT